MILHERWFVQHPNFPVDTGLITSAAHTWIPVGIAVGVLLLAAIWLIGVALFGPALLLEHVFLLGVAWFVALGLGVSEETFILMAGTVELMLGLLLPIYGIMALLLVCGDRYSRKEVAT